MLEIFMTVSIVFAALFVFTGKAFFLIPMLIGDFMHVLETMRLSGTSAFLYWGFVASAITLVAAWIIKWVFVNVFKTILGGKERRSTANSGLAKISQYEEAMELARSSKVSDLKKAYNLFEELGDWKDSAEQAAALKKRIEK